MLDVGTRRGDAAIALFLRRRNGFPRRAFPLDMRTSASLLQTGFALSAGVAAVCIHVPAGIAGIEQIFKDGGVGDSRIRDDDFAHHFVTLDARMERVAKMVLVMFFGPFGVYILLRPLVGRSCRWHDAL